MKTMLFAAAGLLVLLAAAVSPTHAADRYDGPDCRASTVHTAPHTNNEGVTVPGKLCVRHHEKKD